MDGPTRPLGVKTSSISFYKKKLLQADICLHMFFVYLLLYGVKGRGDCILPHLVAPVKKNARKKTFFSLGVAISLVQVLIENLFVNYFS